MLSFVEKRSKKGRKVLPFIEKCRHLSKKKINKKPVPTLQVYGLERVICLLAVHYALRPIPWHCVSSIIMQQ